MIIIDYIPRKNFRKMARIDREDLIGKQARRVLAAIDEERARLGLDLPRALELESVWDNLVDYKIPFPAWPGTEADDEENRRKWRVLDKVYKTLMKEDSRLDMLRRYYEPRTYTVKALDDLTRDEWSQLDTIHLEMLDEFERKRYRV